MLPPDEKCSRGPPGLASPRAVTSDPASLCINSFLPVTPHQGLQPRPASFRVRATEPVASTSPGPQTPPMQNGTQHPTKTASLPQMSCPREWQPPSHSQEPNILVVAPYPSVLTHITQFQVLANSIPCVSLSPVPVSHPGWCSSSLVTPSYHPQSELLFSSAHFLASSIPCTERSWLGQP